MAPSLLLMGAIAYASVYEWEVDGWKNASFHHAVMHLRVFDMKGDPVVLAELDRTIVHPYGSDGTCATDRIIGSSFAPLRATDDLHYFEIHSFASSASQPVCLQFVVGARSFVSVPDGTTALRMLADNPDFGVVADGSGLPVPGKMRTVRATVSLEMAPPPSPPPAAPRFDCERCVVDNRIVNPLCDGGHCPTLIDTVLQLVRHILFAGTTNAYELRSADLQIASTCLSPLESPTQALSANDVIRYAQLALMGQVPMLCAS